MSYYYQCAELITRESELQARCEALEQQIAATQPKPAVRRAPVHIHLTKEEQEDMDERAALEAQLDALKAENAGLKQQHKRLTAIADQQMRRADNLTAENEELKQAAFGEGYSQGITDVRAYDRGRED